MAKEFDGLVAIVTGGASGIGASTVRVLLERGARVAVFDRDLTGVEADAVGVVADVSDDGSVRAAVAATVAAFGRIDILVKNAGIGAQGSVEDNDDEEWARVLDVNVTGVARVSRAVLPYLRISPAAAIVNTCSIAARLNDRNKHCHRRRDAGPAPSPAREVNGGGPIHF